MLSLLEKLERDNIKFVQFEACDHNGLGFGKLVPIAAAKRKIKKGIEYCVGLWMMTSNCNGDMKDWAQTNFRNGLCKIYPDTYTIIPWSSHPVASILMYPTIDNKIVQVDPRTIALAQLNKLKSKYNINLLSSFEHEFFLMDPKTNQPLKSQNGDFRPSLLFEPQFGDFFVNVCNNLEKIGIEIEAIHPEWGKGLYELCTKPKWNIYAGDDAFRVRAGVKEMAVNNDLRATFVSMPFIYEENYEELYKGVMAGAHFNMSLWSNDKKVNLLYDKNNSENELSDICRYWIGGILHHIPALGIFCAPTTNCFERLKGMYKFDKVMSDIYGTWARNDRMRKIRVKPNKEGTHLEFRLPSGLMNPYMIIASVVIAGMDGIENKIEPPLEVDGLKWAEYSQEYKDKNFQKIPMDMKSALDALKADKVLCNEFGEEFITHFVGMKKIEMEDSAKFNKEKKFPCMFSKL